MAGASINRMCDRVQGYACAKQGDVPFLCDVQAVFGPKFVPFWGVQAVFRLEFVRLYLVYGCHHVHGHAFRNAPECEDVLISNRDAGQNMR